MQKIDLAFLMSSGANIDAFNQLDPEANPVSQYLDLSRAKNALKSLLFGSVYSALFRESTFAVAEKFLEQVSSFQDKIIPEDGGSVDGLAPLETLEIKSAFARCQAVLDADLQSISAYIVTKKAGYETAALVENGQIIFPASVEQKVPDAVDDLFQAARCIALESPTAAGFHLHRANEAVLRKYWDSVTNGKKRPKNANMGSFLAELRKSNSGNPATLSQLQALKDFHRNPLMHPDQSLESVEDAIDLMAAIRCSIGYMLKEIDKPTSSPQPSS
jgi:hypothetical protein